MARQHPAFLLLVAISVMAGASDGRADDGEGPHGQRFAGEVSTSFAAPIFGTLALTYGKSVTDRLVGRAFVAYFNREWTPILPDADEWSSRSVYWGLSFAYFPFEPRITYQGIYVGGDIGMAVSKQTYVPLDESDTVFFPFVDLYFFGYFQPIWRGLALDLMIGGGYAPVSHEVSIEGHVNEGDWYPIGDLRLDYRWR